MNSIEMTDVDGDALTVIMRDGDAWITCSSGTEEVTVGPFPLHLIQRALQSKSQQGEQFTATLMGSSAMPPPESMKELRLLPPLTGGAHAAAPREVPLTRRQG